MIFGAFPAFDGADWCRHPVCLVFIQNILRDARSDLKVVFFCIFIITKNQKHSTYIWFMRTNQPAYQPAPSPPNAISCDSPRFPFQPQYFARAIATHRLAPRPAQCLSNFLLFNSTPPPLLPFYYIVWHRFIFTFPRSCVNNFVSLFLVE